MDILSSKNSDDDDSKFARWSMKSSQPKITKNKPVKK